MLCRSIERLRHDVATRYFADYKNHWTNFLNATRILAFENLNDAKQNLEMLSNSMQSPLYLLLKSVYENTRLGEVQKETTMPEQASKKASKSKFDKAAKEIKKYLEDKDDDAVILTDDLARTFSTVHNLMGKVESGEQGPINDYFKRLGGIYGMIETLEGSSQRDREAADFAKKVLKGDGNELTEALKLVTSNTIGSNELRNLLEQPVHQSWIVILKQAQNYFDEEWQVGVWEEFNKFSMSFPFNRNSREDAPLQDVGKFFGPKGTFWAFHETELKEFIEQDRGRWSPKSPPGGLQYGLNFSPECRQAYQQADKITKSMFNAGGSMSFGYDIKPEPYTISSGTNPKITLTFLSFDGNELKYDNSQTEWDSYEWPGQAGAKLVVKTMDTRSIPDNINDFNYEGYWALFRLLERGEQTGRQRTNLTYSWDFFKQGQYRVKISFQFRSKTDDNPFEKGLFSSFKCPSKIGE